MIGVARGRLYALHWDVRERFTTLGFTGALAQLRESERWPRERIERLRDEKLRNLVARAYAVIPGYRGLMDQHGVKPDQIGGVRDLPRLPILTRDLLRERAASLQAGDLRADELEVGTTGGTTGAPIRVVRDLEGTVWQRACYWRGFGWAGLTLDRSWGQLFGGPLGHGARPLNALKNWFAGKVFLPAFELGPHNVRRYVATLRRNDARFLVGYPSACALLATLVEAEGLELRFDAVLPTAELLLPPWRDAIERVFHTRVMPYYGCGEVQSLGYSCPDGDEPVYHTCDEHSVIEVERTDGRVGLEGEGAFLLTDLDNRAMPLIRYRNGDAGTLGAPGCRCGRTLGRILRLDGRVNDVLVSMTGARISGVIGTHAFKFVRGAEAFQVVQRRPGHVIIRVVRGAEYEPSVEESRLCTIFEQHLGPGADVSIEYAKDIPRTAAGKARFVINEYLAAEKTAGGP